MIAWTKKRERAIKLQARPLLWYGLVSCGISLGLAFLVSAHAGQVDDFSQMDNPNQRKQQSPDDLSKEMSRQFLSRMSPEAVQKYQSSVARFKDKNGDEILKILQADRDVSRAARTPKERQRMDDIKQQFDAVARRSMTDPHPISLAEILEKSRVQAIESGTMQPMSARDAAYLDHLKAKIHQRMFASEMVEKNQRMLTESSAYLKASLARQAEYAKNFKDTGNIAKGTKGPPLPLDAMQSNWLVRKLADKNTNINIPLFTELPATTAIAVKARMEAVLSQIRDHKSGTLAERYGPDAQFRPDVTKDTNTSYQDWMRVSGKQANMQENLTAARANNGVPVVPSINAGGEKGKTVAGAPAQKPTAIPGL